MLFFSALQSAPSAWSAGSTKCQVVGCNAFILKSNVAQPTAALLNMSVPNPPKSELHPALCHYRMNSLSTTKPIYFKRKKDFKK